MKLALILTAMAAVVFLDAQEYRSTVSGRVLDPSGAAVTEARIQARERNTGAKYETTTTAAGEYTLPFLPPGPYSVESNTSTKNETIHSDRLARCA